MPFTLSHAAAVLPGIRRGGTARGPLVASALVAGSFAPDTTYFAAGAIPGAMEFGSVTHSPLGIVTVDVLITGALVALWLMLREPLVALLPGRWRGRVYGAVRGRPWRERRPVALVCWTAVSAVIGSATHVGWDAFTHHDRWGTRIVPVLGETVTAGLPGYLFLQYGSSALAAVVLVWWAVRELRTAAMDTPRPAAADALGDRGRLLAAALITVCVLAVAAHRVLRWYAYWGWAHTPFDIIPTLCFGVGAGLVAGLVLYAAAMRLRALAPSRTTAPRTEPAGGITVPGSPHVPEPARPEPARPRR
ncbi:DUF4184 family protein [Streptomyces sp. NPDC048717]|uniref:DUF4184 family protein n=1 Tax=Streptomyces sp. NPDC048717 TaxID=3154928 RepID=UPI003436DFCA